MTTFIFTNNLNTTLAAAASTSATSITLASTANLPSSIPSGSVLVITLNDAATRGNYEVVYATAVTGATLTVERAQEGTSALSWLVGDYVYSGPTKGQQASFAQTGGNNTWTGQNTFDDPVTVANATASGHALTLGQAEADFAALAGSVNQQFNVAQATLATQAMPLGQLPSQFSSSLGLTGWKRYPDPNSPSGYYIEQWGAGNFATQATTSDQLFPITFPNQCANFVCSVGYSIPTTSFVCVGGQAINNSSFNITVSSATVGSGSVGVQWRAIGY